MIYPKIYRSRFSIKILFLWIDFVSGSIRYYDS